MPVYFWVSAGVRVSFMAVATARAANAAGIITVIIFNLYAFVMVPRRDLFWIVRTLLPGLIIWI